MTCLGSNLDLGLDGGKNVCVCVGGGGGGERNGSQDLTVYLQ